MANNDRVSKALGDVISALTELKEAWDEQMTSYTPQVIISDAPPIDLGGVQETASQPAAEPEPAPAPVTFETPTAQNASISVPPVFSSPGAVVMESQPAPQIKPASSNTCPLCGAVADPGSKFCLMCGTSLSQQPAPMQGPSGRTFCQKCGAEIMPGDRFCVGCGSPLAGN